MKTQIPFLLAFIVFVSCNRNEIPEGEWFCLYKTDN